MLSPDDLINVLHPTFHFPFFPSRLTGILMVIFSEGHECDFGLISKRLGISKPATSRLLDTASEHGFAKRLARHDKDRRLQPIKLTAEGQAFCKSMLEAA